jgi:acetoin utilization deacetylase AcuC-like enzyme
MRWGLRGSDAIYEKDILAKLEYFKDCDILFYQAGADAHIDDPLGGLLTTAQMKARDRLVFNFAKDNNIPLVWNLAGGYQDPVAKVVQLHMNTLEECIAVYGDR